MQYDSILEIFRISYFVVIPVVVLETYCKILYKVNMELKYFRFYFCIKTINNSRIVSDIGY